MGFEKKAQETCFLLADELKIKLRDETGIHHSNIMELQAGKNSKNKPFNSLMANQDSTEVNFRCKTCWLQVVSFNTKISSCIFIRFWFPNIAQDISFCKRSVHENCFFHYNTKKVWKFCLNKCVQANNWYKCMGLTTLQSNYKIYQV